MKSTLKPERLISCRQRLGLTQTEAANRVGVSQPAYQRYEAGLRTPSVQVVREMAKALNVSESFLTGESDQSSPDYVVVSQKDTPLLFSIMEQCKDLDDKQLEILLEQFKRLSREIKRGERSATDGWIPMKDVERKIKKRKN